MLTWRHFRLQFLLGRAMIRIWIFAIVATVFALTPVRASDATFTLVGASEKVCQLNGDTDWKTGLPTAAQTATNFGMYAADLGAPVDTGDSTLYFLFGDTWPSFPAAAGRRETGERFRWHVHAHRDASQQYLPWKEP
jgi:hypothetical protein